MKEIVLSTTLSFLLYVANLKFLGGWSTNLEVIIIVMVIDYITGCIVAIVFKHSTKTDTGGYSSNIGVKGLFKKVGIIFCLWVGYLLEKMTGLYQIKDMLIYGFTINEVMSILENLSLMGLKIPPAINNALDVLRKKEEEEDDTGNTREIKE